MAAFQFPASPIIGQVHTQNNVSFKFNGVGWVMFPPSVEFPTGTRLIFQQTSAPPLWTKELNTTYADAAMRMTVGTPAVAGAAGFSAIFGPGKVTGGTAITIAQMPSHDHGTFTASENAAHTHQYNDGTPLVDQGAGPSLGSGGNRGADIVRTTGGQSANHQHQIGAQGSGAVHTHALSLDLKYVECIIGIRL